MAVLSGQILNSYHPAKWNAYRKRNCFRYVNSTALYQNTSILRLDVQLAKLNLKFHEKCFKSTNEQITNFATKDNNAIVHFGFTSLLYDLGLKNELFINDKLVIFNQGKNNRNNNNLVYSTNQCPNY